ncbi:hypothetical protein AT05_09040 [Schleiferia thermophila str. Yellowstone]|nr:hypothetical protein AT05_09040 [Schleiferia thermophila str. Yellowstone]
MQEFSNPPKNPTLQNFNHYTKKPQTAVYFCRKKFLRKKFLPFLIFLIAFCTAANPKPRVRTFGPTVTKGSGVNWQIAQNVNGYIFIASSSGVKIFDGYNWEIVKNNLNTEIYSLDIDEKNCLVYTGGLDDLGYIDLDEKNQFTYFSLVNLLPASQPSLGRVWQTIINGNIYFFSNKYIFEFDGTRFKIHKAENNTFHKAFKTSRHLIVQEEGIGLYALHDKRKIFIKNSDQLNNKIIESIVEVPDGLVMFTSDGISIQCTLKDHELSIQSYFTTEVSEYIKSGRLSNISGLYDGNYVFALGNNGIIITKPDFKILYHFNSDNNLTRSSVNHVYEDRFGNLWSAENTVVNFINYGSPFSVYDSKDGIKGVVHSFLNFKGTVFCADEFYIYQFENFSFTPLDKISESIRGLFHYNEQNFLLLTNKGLYLADEKNRKKILEFQEGISVFTISESQHLYGVFNPHSILIFSLKGNKARIHKVRIFENVELKNVEVENEQILWFSTTANGVGFWHDDYIRFYDTKSGLPSYFNNQVKVLNGRVYILTQEGVYKLDKYRNSLLKTNDFGPLAKSYFVNNMLLTPIGLFAKFTKGTESEYLLLNDSIDQNSTFNRIFKYLPKRGFAGWHLTEDNLLLISFIENMYVLDLNKSHKIFQPLKISIRDITFSSPGMITEENNRKKIVINYDQGPLVVYITSPYYEGQNFIKFFYRLKNQSADWIKLENSNTIVIPKLNIGDDELQIYATNIYEMTSDVLKIPFKVLPPFYLRSYMIALYILVLMMAAYGVLQYRESLLQKKNRELEKIVEMRTKELLKEKQELERSKEELFQLSEQRNQLLGVYAHDLKNPLSAIDGIRALMSHTIEEMSIDTSTKEEFIQYLEMIKKSTDQTTAIIQDILTSVKLESDKQKLEFSDVEISGLVEEHYQLMNNYARQKNIQMTYHTDGKYLVTIDARKMGEVFQNLMSNAIKYSPENSNVKVVISSAVKKGREYAVISISDQGPGFTEDDKQKMFGLFQRLSAKPTKGESSTGIGLYIVKNYTELNNGFVELESELGKGSTFKVYLPVLAKINF